MFIEHIMEVCDRILRKAISTLSNSHQPNLSDEGNPPVPEWGADTNAQISANGSSCDSGRISSVEVPEDSGKRLQ